MIGIKHWIEAFRLRTLPLSLSGVFTGSAVALYKKSFSFTLFVLAIATTLSLQILSNLANDYGDFKNGADNAERIGPKRSVQSGKITPNAMRWMIAIFIILSLLTGIFLIVKSQINIISLAGLILLGTGILAMAAAYFYTAGPKPYGYVGLGDISVFLFFGLFSVLGLLFLYTGTFEIKFLIPAISIGFLCTAVLNLNNLRDHEGDRNAGKKTVVVIAGTDFGIYYHLVLVLLALIGLIISIAVKILPLFASIGIFVGIPLYFQWRRIRNVKEWRMLDRELKPLALMTFLISVLLLIGSIMDHVLR